MTAIRYANSFHATSVSLDALLLQGLSDPSGWVVYDAAWLAGDIGMRTGAVRDQLDAVAEGTAPHFDGDSQAWSKARERAKKALEG